MNKKENNDKNQTVYFGMIYVPNGLVTWSRLKEDLYTESQICPSGYQGNLQQKVAVFLLMGSQDGVLVCLSEDSAHRCSQAKKKKKKAFEMAVFSM